jgi:hypothetical protein
VEKSVFAVKQRRSGEVTCKKRKRAHGSRLREYGEQTAAQKQAQKKKKDENTEEIWTDVQTHTKQKKKEKDQRLWTQATTPEFLLFGNYVCVCVCLFLFVLLGKGVPQNSRKQTKKKNTRSERNTAEVKSVQLLPRVRARQMASNFFLFLMKKGERRSRRASGK